MNIVHLALPPTMKRKLARMARIINEEISITLRLLAWLGIQRIRPVQFYSKLRGDRSGAQLHDELMAYGFCFANGLTYSGTSTAIDTNELQNLRTKVGLPVNHSSDKRVNLPSYLYRDDKNNSRFKLMSKYFLDKARLNAPSTPDEIFSDRFIEHLRSRALADCTTIRNNVVIHIRRGDVNLTDHPKRFTEIAYYVDLILRIKAHSPRFTFIVHSETQNLSAQEIQELESVGATLKLDADISIAWDDMIRAEILIPAKSSFSYVPALLCTGTVIYSPFWHQKRYTWIDYNNFDEHLVNIPR
jgi:hypothetical protein